MVKCPTRKKGIWSNLAPYAFILPWIVGFIIFTLIPLAFSLVISFFDWPIVGTPKFIGLNNYITMFTDDPLFWKSFFITLKFAALFVPLNILISLFFAILLNQNVKGLSFFRTVFYLPSVISGVAISIVWAWVFSKDYGILNYILSLVGVQGPNWLGDKKWAIIAMVIASLWGQGSMIFIFLAGLKNIPKELYEAAAIDGANNIQQFFKITLPMLSPTILFNLITTVISAFQQLTLALLLTGGGPAYATYFYAMFVYDNAFKYFKMGYSAANAWFMFIVILLLTFLIFKSSSSWVYYESEEPEIETKKKSHRFFKAFVKQL